MLVYDGAMILNVEASNYWFGWSRVCLNKANIRNRMQPHKREQTDAKRISVCTKRLVECTAIYVIRIPEGDK